jgi:hypothetical protein
MDLTTLSIEDLRALADERRTAYSAALTAGATTLAEVEAIEALRDDRDAALAEIGVREAADAEVAERLAALQTAEASEEAEEAAEEEVEEAADEAVEAAEETEEASAEAPTPSRVAALARRTERPVAPKRTPASTVTITAAADVPNIAMNSRLDIAGVASGLVDRLKAYGAPSGRGGERGPGYVPDLRTAGVAKFKQEFPEDLQINRKSDDLSVIEHAGNESRLDGGSLVAAGGWCAPSENLYDLCEGETLDGLVSVPEIQVNRGGINFTKGPDFSSLYAEANLGFIQTEAQAEAGTEKPCYEVECPDWTDHRLDAMGVCLMVPILTESAFPELIQRVVRGALVVHAHKRNATILSRMTTIAGAALVGEDFTTTAHSTLANLEQIGDLKRQAYRLGLNETLEVVVPFWVRGAIRNDLALRNGLPIDAVTDAYIASEFSARNMNVQYVYDWQPLPANTVGYPATFDALMYPAGTFVVGTSDVINLNAVYDHASLVTNTYTGLFFEEGILVANRCYDADLVTIAVCGSGHTGIVNVNQCGLSGA